MTSGGGEGRTNWESVTLIRIYLNITWTQQGLRIGYFDFSQVHSRRYFSKFPRYTAGFIFRIFPGTQQVLYVTNHHKIVGIQQALKLKNVT